MRKRVFILLGLALSAVAVAAFVEGARGRGAAVNAHHERAEFVFEAYKHTIEHQTHVRGEFKFWTADHRHNAMVHLYMPRPHELVREGNVVTFAGEATMYIRRHQTHVAGETIRGILRVTVRDNRNHEHPHGDPDLLSLRFHVPHHNFVYEWAGRVTRGDIQVFAREY